MCDRSQCAGTSHLHTDVFDHRTFLPRGELQRDRPAGSLRRPTERALLRDGIDFRHETVDLIRQRIAFHFPASVLLQQIVDALAYDAMRIDLESQRNQRIERFPMAVERRRPVDQQKVREVVELPGSGDRGIEVAQRARRGVAGIRKARLPFGVALGIQTIECSPIHDHLAANFVLRPVRPGGLQRQRFDGPRILCHVLADGSVASRDRLVEPAVAIVRRQRKPVHLQLDRIAIGLIAQQLAHAPVEVDQLALIERIVETQHRRRVPDLDESLARLAAHALRRRIRGRQFRMRGFERLQFAHHRVVFGVGDFRRIEHIVQMLVAAQFFAQMFGFRLQGGVMLLHCRAGLSYRNPSIRCQLNNRKRGIWKAPL